MRFRRTNGMQGAARNNLKNLTPSIYIQRNVTQDEHDRTRQRLYEVSHHAATHPGPTLRIPVPGADRQGCCYRNCFHGYGCIRRRTGKLYDFRRLSTSVAEVMIDMIPMPLISRFQTCQETLSTLVSFTLHKHTGLTDHFVAGQIVSAQPATCVQPIQTKLPWF